MAWAKRKKRFQFKWMIFMYFIYFEAAIWKCFSYLNARHTYAVAHKSNRWAEYLFVRPSDDVCVCLRMRYFRWWIFSIHWRQCVSWIRALPLKQLRQWKLATPSNYSHETWNEIQKREKNAAKCVPANEAAVPIDFRMSNLLSETKKSKTTCADLLISIL